PGDAARAPLRRRHRPLHPLPLGRPGVLRHAAQRRRGRAARRHARRRPARLPGAALGAQLPALLPGLRLRGRPRARHRPGRRRPEYQSYTAEVKQAAEAINERSRTRTWEPVVLELRDNYPRALAAMAVADVLLVNPIWDGMNLVAKEGPTVSQRDAVLVLSRN